MDTIAELVFANASLARIAERIGVSKGAMATTSPDRHELPRRPRHRSARTSIPTCWPCLFAPPSTRSAIDAVPPRLAVQSDFGAAHYGRELAVAACVV